MSADGEQINKRINQKLSKTTSSKLATPPNDS
jgi:hypothetical protein